MIKKLEQYWLKHLRKLQKSRAVVLDTDLQKLGEQMGDYSLGVGLDEGQKLEMGQNLEGAIRRGDTELPGRLRLYANKMKSVSGQVTLSSAQKSLMWQEISEKIGVNNNPGFSWVKTLKVSMASLLIMFMGLTFLVISPLELRVTRASKWTFLEAVKGEVYVNRNGRTMSVNDDFSLQQGDLVFTKSGSFVVIRYLDDSVTRLGENTSLEIKKLTTSPANGASTQVEISLVGGQLWASVYNLIDQDSKFAVETENAVAEVDNKAAFEMNTDAEETTLAVFDNVVDFRKKSNTLAQSKPVVSGFKAKLSEKNLTVMTDNTLDILIVKNDLKNDDWAKMNLDLDQIHTEQLKSENQKFVADTLAKNNIIVGTIADFKDNTNLFFANGDIEKARVRFVNAQLDFLKAQQLLLDGVNDSSKRREALPLIYGYKTAVKDIMAALPEYQQQSAEQTAILFGQIKENIGFQSKSLSLVLPNEPLYTAKFALIEVSSYLAINDAEKAEFLLGKASNRLLEVESLINVNDLKGAEASFDAYLADLDSLVDQLQYFNAADVETRLFALLSEQIKQFKSIKSIEKKLLDKDDQILLKLVARVNSTNLEKLIAVFKAYRKHAIPFELLAQLDSTVSLYIDEGEERDSTMGELETMMMVYPEYTDWKQSLEPKPAAEEEQQIEMPIVDLESSAQVDLNQANQ